MNQKHIAMKAPGMERYIRLRSLGEAYSEMAIRERILLPKEQQRAARLEGPKKKLSGLQALYYSYLYQMGVLKKKPRRVSPQFRQDIKRLDERISQMEFLQKHGITTREELEAYKKPLEERMLELIKERRKLYGTVSGAPRIDEIKREVKELRKEIRMCVKIHQTSVEIEQKMEEARNRNKQVEQMKEQPEMIPEKEWR